MELCYARRLLLEFGWGCSSHGVKATGKKKKKRYIYILHGFVCAK